MQPKSRKIMLIIIFIAISLVALVLSLIGIMINDNYNLRQAFKTHNSYELLNANVKTYVYVALVIGIIGIAIAFVAMVFGTLALLSEIAILSYNPIFLVKILIILTAVAFVLGAIALGVGDNIDNLFG